MCDSVTERLLLSRYEDDGSDFQYLLDYGAYRYHIALLFNYDAESDAVENITLKKLCTAMARDDNDEIDCALGECEDLLYPFMKADYDARSKGSTATILHSSNGVIKLKAWTVDGLFQAGTDDLELVYPPNPPVDNIFPDVAVFPSYNVERIDEPVMDIFKIKFNDAIYCLKSVHRSPNKTIICEVSLLMACSHPNITRFIGVTVNADGKVDGMLTDWLKNARPISEIENVSVHEAAKWIGQIKDAVNYLHQKSLVWGDAKAANVLVNMDGDAILVDFGGGFTDDWVEQRHCGTVKGDLQGLERIVSFINERIN